MCDSPASDVPHHNEWISARVPEIPLLPNIRRELPLKDLLEKTARLWDCGAIECCALNHMKVDHKIAVFSKWDARLARTASGRGRFRRRVIRLRRFTNTFKTASSRHQGHRRLRARVSLGSYEAESPKRAAN